MEELARMEGLEEEGDSDSGLDKDTAEVDLRNDGQSQ